MLRDLFSLFPAHAGVILYNEWFRDENLAFPRTCGGDPMCAYIFQNVYKLFPAHAGVILYPDICVLDTFAFPRTCGGDPCRHTAVVVEASFSPHMRG